MVVLIAVHVKRKILLTKPSMVTLILVNELFFLNAYYSLPHLFLLLVPPSITKISGKIVMEGENVTLNCPRNGKPIPSIKWTRLSDNHTVNMPLINISRHDAGDYRCTAVNGVGTPATREVSIDVQCK